MTDEGGEPAQVDTISELKAMFEQQFAEMKKQNEETVSKLNETIDQLKKDNSALQAAVVRSASMDPPKAEPVKSPEEIYREQIDQLKGKAFDTFKTRGNY